MARLRDGIEHDPRPLRPLLPPAFTGQVLRGVYEMIAGERADPVRIDRIVRRLLEDGKLVPSGADTPGRAARLYRLAGT